LRGRLGAFPVFAFAIEHVTFSRDGGAAASNCRSYWARAGLDQAPIRSPSVPKGGGRLRGSIPGGLQKNRTPVSGGRTALTERFGCEIHPSWG
jgi:hypothetical protein